MDRRHSSRGLLKPTLATEEDEAIDAALVTRVALLLDILGV
jgi:hypothetical protein